MADSAEADGSAPSVPSTLEEKSQGRRVIVILKRVSDRISLVRAVVGRAVLYVVIVLSDAVKSSP